MRPVPGGRGHADTLWPSRHAGSITHLVERASDAIRGTTMARTKVISKKSSAANDTVIYHTLGRTGEKVSAIGLGGFHLGQPSLSEEDSIRLIRSAIDRGITFMDNSWDYNEGQSEIRMGKALRDGYRGKVFLMTKIDGRTRQEAQKQIDESLRRLQTDCVDLIQHHEIIRYEDPDRIFAKDGATEALLQ